MLVIGDHGSGGEGKPKQHPKGQPPMGKCAEACINSVKVPMLLVRGYAKALLEQHHSGGTTQRRGKRTQDSRGNLHDEAPGGHGLNIAVCVDDSNLSKKVRLPPLTAPLHRPPYCPLAAAGSLLGPQPTRCPLAPNRTASYHHSRSHAISPGLRPGPQATYSSLLTTYYLLTDY